MLVKDKNFNKKISLNIGGAFSHNLLSLVLKLNLNRKFNITVYDGVNNCPWNGGRINRDIYISQNNIEKYNKYNIRIAFTFSNPEINLNNKKGLELLNWLNNSQNKYKIQNEIILINEELRIFLRENYNFILKFSITGHNLLAYPNKNLQKEYIKYYKELENKYNIIVPKMEHIFQDWFINNLNLQKYELMTNDTCRPDCPYYKKHFEEIARINTIFKDEKSSYNFNPILSKSIEECWLPNFNPNKELTSCKTGMDFDKNLFKKALKLGYKNFKISGRENTIKDIENDIRRIL